VNFLPSKKFILALFAFTALCGFAFVFLKDKEIVGTGAQPKLSASNQDSARALAAQITLKDTDNDGLRDWEESLWGTNINNPDTDGDGTKDGAEIAANRNPAIPGPDDLLSVGTKTSKGSGEESGKTLTPTEKLAQRVFGKYLSLRQSGGTLDEKNSVAIIDSALGEMSPYATVNTYSASDLIIVKEENAVTIRTYGNVLGEIINRYGKPDVDNELVIVGVALNTNDAKKLSELSKITESYRAVISALAKTPVPQGAVVAHLSLLNSAEAVTVTITAMESLFTDPLTALTALQDYNAQSDNLAAALDRLDSYFRNNRITFSPDEPGAIFFPELVATQ